MRTFLRLLLLVLLMQPIISLASLREDDDLIYGFIYLEEIDPSIINHLKYAGNSNIFQQRLPGFVYDKIILTIQTANALKQAQQDLVAMGYSLVVYDAYRPLASQLAMESWLQTETNKDVKRKYHPNLTKIQLSKQGYIKEKAAHLRGSTVDVTLIKIGNKINDKLYLRRKAYIGHKYVNYLDDGTEDMGSSYDTLDAVSCHDCAFLHKEALANRLLLRNMMEGHGFKASKKYWWQYTLVREPFPDTQYEFDIK